MIKGSTTWSNAWTNRLGGNFGLADEGLHLSLVIVQNSCMKVPPTEPTQRAGVAFTELTVTRDFGWLFREQLESDLGVDAHVEIVADGRGTGGLLGLQIKTGPSYLKEKSDSGFLYRPDNRHVETGLRIHCLY